MGLIDRNLTECPFSCIFLMLSIVVFQYLLYMPLVNVYYWVYTKVSLIIWQQ